MTNTAAPAPSNQPGRSTSNSQNGRRGQTPQNTVASALGLRVAPEGQPPAPSQQPVPSGQTMPATGDQTAALSAPPPAGRVSTNAAGPAPAPVRQAPAQSAVVQAAPEVAPPFISREHIERIRASAAAARTEGPTKPTPLQVIPGFKASVMSVGKFLHPVTSSADRLHRLFCTFSSYRHRHRIVVAHIGYQGHVVSHQPCRFSPVDRAYDDSVPLLLHGCLILFL